MEQLIYPASACGRISAIPSKSDVHRLLLCAALADAPTEITVGEGILSEDIRATARCIRRGSGCAERTPLGNTDQQDRAPRAHGM